MDSTYHFIDTFVVKYQNATDTICSTVPKCTKETASVVTNYYDFLIAFFICVTVLVVVISAVMVVGGWYITKQKSNRSQKERDFWIVLKKEYQKLALEHIKAKEDCTLENDLYLKYINKYIYQIDEHLKILLNNNKNDVE